MEEACLIKWLSGDPNVRNCNLKLEYNRSIVPELGDPEAPTQEEIRKDEEITRKILEWRQKQKEERPTTERKKNMIDNNKRKERDQQPSIEKGQARIRLELMVKQKYGDIYPEIRNIFE